MTMTALDYEGIRQLLARYCLALDFGHATDFARCFALDGCFEFAGLPPESHARGRFEGREKLISLAQNLFAATQGHARHWASSTPRIEGDGETATGVLYLIALRVGEVPDTGIVVTGVYRDRYVKIDGEWLFASRHLTADPQPENKGTTPTDVLVVRFDQFVSALNKLVATGS